MATDNKNEKKNTPKKTTAASKTQSNVAKKNTTKTVKSSSTKTTTQNKKTESKSSTKQTPSKKVETKPNKKTGASTPKKTTAKSSASSKNVESKAKTTSSKTTATKNKNSKTKVPSEKTKQTKVEEINTTQVVKELHVEEETITKQETKPVTKKENINDVRSILGAPMPLGSSLKDRKTRKKYYLIDALVFSIVIPILDLLAMLFIEAYKPLLVSNVDFINYGATVLLDFILIFIITYLIDFVFGEEAVKKSK